MMGVVLLLSHPQEKRLGEQLSVVGEGQQALSGSWG